MANNNCCIFPLLICSSLAFLLAADGVNAYFTTILSSNSFTYVNGQAIGGLVPNEANVSSALSSSTTARFEIALAVVDQFTIFGLNQAGAGFDMFTVTLNYFSNNPPLYNMSTTMYDASGVEHSCSDAIGVPLCFPYTGLSYCTWDGYEHAISVTVC